MGTLVAITWSRRVPSGDRARVRELAWSALRLRDETEPTGFATEDLCIVTTLAKPASWERLAITQRASDRHPAGWPPGGELVTADGEATFTTDIVGLRRLYSTVGSGWAAVSTSALALAAMSERGLDQDSWATRALLGFVPGEMTLFDGVVALPGDHRVRLRRGGLSTRRVAAAEAPPLDGAQAVRTAVTEQLAAAPDAAIELSGGLDSRVILAGIPPEARRGRTAMTIGSAEDPDVVIASRIAAEQGLEHAVIPTPRFEDRDPDEVAQMIAASGRARDHAADPLTAVVLDAVERLAPDGPRLTGVNGEYARGFYYAGLPALARVRRTYVSRLVRWRMITNHRAAERWFVPGWLDGGIDHLIDACTSSLASSDRRLRPATDDYYLRQRVVGWAGPGYSHAATQRPVLAPFLHPAFLRWVADLPAAQRSGSRAFARALVHLDHGLAQLELAGGPSPEALAGRDLASAVQRSRHVGGKAARKVQQLRRGTGRPSRGVHGPLAALRRSWLLNDPRPTLSKAPFIDTGHLETADWGTSMDAATAGFLVDLLGVIRYLEAVRSSAPSEEPA